MANQGTATYTIQDYSREKSTSQMNVGVVTGASLPGLLTNLGTFKTALQGVIIGTIFKEALNVYDNPTGNAKPTNVYAQREIRWIVHYHDNTPTFGLEPNNAFGRAYTVEFACPNLSLLVDGTDLMNIASGAGQTFVTEFQDTFLAPSGGAAVVDYVELVGRKG
jgi:hypothetical protein